MILSVFSKWFIFPIFVWYSLWEPVELLEIKWQRSEVPLWWGSHGSFNSQSCPHWVSNNLLIIIKICLPQHWFSGRFLHVDFCHWLVVVFCVHLSPQFGGRHLPCDLTSVIDLRRDVDSFVCSAFYLIGGWSGNFQAPICWTGELFPLFKRNIPCMFCFTKAEEWTHKRTQVNKWWIPVRMRDGRSQPILGYIPLKITQVFIFWLFSITVQVRWDLMMVLRTLCVSVRILAPRGQELCMLMPSIYSRVEWWKKGRNQGM